jgi:hypothetical protein
VAIDLSAAERIVLCRALRAHRRGIPIYLKSGEDERRMVDELLARLACPTA